MSVRTICVTIPQWGPFKFLSLNKKKHKLRRNSSNHKYTFLYTLVHHKSLLQLANRKWKHRTSEQGKGLHMSCGSRPDFFSNIVSSLRLKVDTILVKQLFVNIRYVVANPKGQLISKCLFRIYKFHQK